MSRPAVLQLAGVYRNFEVTFGFEVAGEVLTGTSMNSHFDFWGTTSSHFTTQFLYYYIDMINRHLIRFLHQSVHDSESLGSIQ